MLSCSAILATMALFATLSSASLAATRPLTVRASNPVTVAASGDCEWRSTGAYPRLYIRKDPNTHSETVGSIPYREFFFGSCNLTNGFIFVDDPSFPFGWANAHYCSLVTTARETAAAVSTATNTKRWIPRS
jgi:hypothetical protein